MNYYNEHDPKAAEWLRELIKAGQIAEGKVDERSIADVQPADLVGFGQCHFFAGIGGWSYALRLAGWPDDRPVWTGSCPCQPYSAAGKGLGNEDPRNLWPQFRRLIEGGRPADVFGEQVASAAGRLWLDGVRVDLETLGYEVGAADLCAAGFGAPHIRQRLYWVAYAEYSDRRRKFEQGEQGEHRRSGFAGSRTPNGLANTEHDGGRTDEQGRQSEGREIDGRIGRMANVQQPGLERHAGDGDDRDQPGRFDSESNRSTAESSGAGGMAESDGRNTRNGEEQRSGEQRQQQKDGGNDEGVGDTSGSGSWRDAGTISGEERKSECQRIKSRCFANESVTANPWSNFQLIRCRDGKARRIESGTFPLVNGLPGRVGLLRGYGNAIVPIAAAEFIQASEEARSERA